jgi:hypothetical protein
MAKFWQLLEESVIIQAFLTIGVWASVIVLIFMGRSIPEVLSAGCYTILGFWFGSKTASQIAKAAARSTPPQ